MDDHATHDLLSRTVHPFVKGRSRVFWIAFSFSALALIARSVEWWYGGSTDNRHPAVERTSPAIISSIQHSFNEYQQETHEAARRFALMHEVRNNLSEEPNQGELFKILERAEILPEMNIEVYDRNHHLLAWWGVTAGLHHAAIDIQRETSFVSAGPVYSYLTVIVPVLMEEEFRGSVVAHRLFDVNYPLSNRFISSDAFTQTFPRRLDYPVSFHFHDEEDTRQVSNDIKIPLQGVRGNTLGYALIDELKLSTTRQPLQGIAEGLWRSSLAALFFLVSILAIRRIHGLASIGLRVVAIVGITVALRYGLLWVEFPSWLFNQGIFDPRYFASSFGFGIARSIGELFLTSFAGLAAVMYVARLTLPGLLSPVEAYVRLRSALHNLAAMALLWSLPVLYFFLHRGFTAFLRSAVLDSTLRYSDPTSVLPSFELAVMTLNLFLVTMAFTVASVVLLLSAYRLLGKWFGRRFLVLTLGVAIFVAVGFLFGIMHPSPLAGNVSRLLVLSIVFVIATTVFLQSGVRFFSLVLSAIGALILVVFQLDDQVHLRERRNIERMGMELARPADAWITYVLERTLSDMEDNRRAVDILQSEDVDRLYDLAFTLWSGSFLSRVGYNCGVYVYDPDGHLVSYFRIGVRQEELRMILNALVSPISADHGQIRIREEESAEGRRKFYVGSTTFLNSNGILLGSVGIGIVSSGHLFSRSAMPPFLQTFESEETERSLRALHISEFVNGVLAYTTAEEIASRLRLPVDVEKQLPKLGGVWYSEEMNGSLVETFYTRIDGEINDEVVLALARKKEDWRWHVFDFMRYFLLFFLVSLAISGIVLGVLAGRGYPIALSFRAKLFLAFFLVSLIPLLLIAYYNRDITIERAHQLIIDRLTRESAFVRERLLGESRRSGPLTDRSGHRFSDEWCEVVAEEMGTDFSIYVNAEKRASSQPELFQVGILDGRLSASAFYHIMLLGKNFYAEKRMIGNYDYLMGYRSLYSDPDSREYGVLAVPLLYSQLEIAEDLTRRNILLFGAYALILGIIIVLGTVFASRISAPIHQLINATQRIAKGELDFRLPAARKDEIGELHRAFNTMTEDLQRNRESLIKAERETAWREMAKQVAHEIKNPLTPVRLSIQHLRQAFRDKDREFPELLERVVKTVIDQIDALSRIASQFAHFARMPDRREEDVDLQEVIAEVVKLFDEYKEVKMRVIPSTETIVLRADREELRRAFINILRNAVQAMNEKGDVTIKAGSTRESHLVTITDSGPGISSDILPRLFEPNFSTKSEGMGLGLAIVKRTIDDLRGHIQIQSQQGKGATITITLPKAGTT